MTTVTTSSHRAVPAAVPAARPVRRKRRSQRAKYVVNTIVVITAAVFAFPIYWMINTAFKSANEYQTLTPHFLPQEPTLVNFTTAIHVGITDTPWHSSSLPIPWC